MLFRTCVLAAGLKHLSLWIPQVRNIWQCYSFRHFGSRARALLRSASDDGKWGSNSAKRQSARDNIVLYSRSWLASPDEYRLCTSKSIPEPSFIVIHLECRGSTADTNSASVYGAIQTISGHFLREGGARILKSVSRRFHRHWIHARTSDHGVKAMIAPICFLVVSRSFLARVVHVLPHFADYAEHRAFRISYVLYSTHDVWPHETRWTLRVRIARHVARREDARARCRCACCLLSADSICMVFDRLTFPWNQGDPAVL